MDTVSPRRELPADRRVELCVRDLSSRTGHETRERAIGLLGSLDDAGVLDSFSVRVWGREVGLSTTAVETGRGEEVLERVGTFRRWATRTGVSLEPFFDARATTSRITGEEYTTLRLPVAALAEYENDDPVYVTPHEDHGTVRTVADRLDRFEQGLDSSGDRAGHERDREEGPVEMQTT